MSRIGALVPLFAVLSLAVSTPGIASSITAGEAGEHIGETATVCGLVASSKHATSVRGEPTFLDFDKPHPQSPFTVVIWGSDRAAFGQPEVAYKGKRICVTGVVESYKGKPEIVARRPSQIELSK